MPLLGPAQRQSNHFFTLAISTVNSDPTLQAATSLTYTEIRNVDSVDRGDNVTYDTTEVTANTDLGVKSHIKTLRQANGIKGFTLQTVGTDPGLIQVAAAENETQFPRVFRYRPGGNFTGDREEFVYAFVTGIKPDSGSQTEAIKSVVTLQPTGAPIIRAIP
jgi:hypothetical protein